ncbi:MAG TPA: ATP-binding protein [Acidimicrobiia bacterium]|jgi:signal transduction histidine kinase
MTVARASNVRLPLRAKLVAGRTVALTGMVLAAAGVTILAVIGRFDHLSHGAAMFGVFGVAFGLLGWLALPRRPDNRAVWVVAWSALTVGVSGAGWGIAVLAAQRSGLDVSIAGWTTLAPIDVPDLTVLGMQLGNLGPAAGFFSMLTFWLLLFPDGRLPSRRWRPVVGATVLAMATLLFLLVWVTRRESTVAYMSLTSQYPGIAAYTDAVYLALLALSAVCFASLIVRYRISTGDLRQQYRWVLLGTAALFFAVFVVDENQLLLVAALAGVVVSVTCYAVAVTKHRLYDIDVVISRAIVYGTLAAFIGAVYVMLVVVVGEMAGARAADLGLSVAATALVAVAFGPVRQRAQKWANRVVYGKRATPYEVLTTVARRLAGAEPAQGVLERMAQLMAEGTGAERTTVWLRSDGGLEAAAGWPDTADPGRVGSMEDLRGVLSAVHHDGELVGVLEVEKTRGNPVTPTEQRLLADLAGSAGLLLGNQRLNAARAARAAELRASRRRLVELQDAERRRLERDLHDGAQQQVVALKLKLALAEHMARRAGAADLAADLDGLAAEAQESLDEIRRLARGLYPQLLEHADVATAIRSQAAAYPVAVQVAVEGVGHYPREVEAAVFYAAVEALVNAATYAAPDRIRVKLQGSEDEITVEVSDDGTGFDSSTTQEGIGLTSIRDRVEALGGDLWVESTPGVGTSVRARIPILDGAESLLPSAVGGPV